MPDFEEACKRANVPYTVSARPKMVHCYCMLPIFKEAKEDFAKIVDILKNEIGNGRVMIETRRKNHGTKRSHSRCVPNDGRKQFYDGMITCSTLSGKAVCRLVWAMNKAENDAYLEKAMSGIPEHFSGKLLEVPVGTGILTMPVYQTMPEADITCLDYSPDMMGQAREKG